MRRINGWTTKLAALGMAGALMLSGCGKNPMDDGDQNKDKINAEVTASAKSTVGAFRTVASVGKVTNILRGPDARAQTSVPGMEKVGDGARLAGNLLGKARRIQAERGINLGLSKPSGPTGDVVIWDVTWRDEVNQASFHNSLIYNDETGHARLFHVMFELGDQYELAYDSTELKLDLNFTLEDSTDDLVLSLYNLKEYKPGVRVQRIEATFTPDPYAPGSEIDGGVIEATTTYDATEDIAQTFERLEFHADETGSWRKEIDYSNGDRSWEQVSFHGDGTASISELRRDGTRVDGTFDDVEDDGHGGFDITTTFPAGHDPVRIVERGEFDVNEADSTMSGSFEKTTHWQDGSEDKEEFSVEENISAGVKTTTIHAANSAEGTEMELTLVEAPGQTDLSGWQVHEDGTYLRYEGTGYPDGSGRLSFELYASRQAYEDGDDPILYGTIYFNPDGSGHGDITQSAEHFEVTVLADGTEVIEASK